MMPMHKLQGMTIEQGRASTAGPRPCSDGCSDGCISELSTASCSYTSRVSHIEVRRRYLNRLGIRDESQQHRRTSSGEGGNLGDLEFTSSCSAPEDIIGSMPKLAPTSLRQSLSHGAMPASSTVSSQHKRTRQEKIILLRRSVQYTTRLKFGSKDEESSSQPNSTRFDEEITKIAAAPKSSPSKFELSSAWMTLLSKDTASTTSASAEPLDGAYDLFSLPSNSSIAASVIASSPDTGMAMDRLPSRDSLSTASTMPNKRKVSFDATVKAATIPSRFSYSNRIRTRLWSGTDDIYANAVRSEKEYAFDGNDWRTAREESDFLRCPSASSASPEGLLVHPAHFRGWATPSPPQSCWNPAPSTVSNCGSALSSSRSGEGGNTDKRTSQDDDYSGGMFEMD
eukprot:CAMPEP_0181120000 /NCGR_PEP_ID=MMETSP1071-20121207/23906_1 /TAXON_ID=35127 /ORGANISM="Thalassiosira sp., Strain NH16" /LENGTH=396 /DNA_ID=CAMNT_0023204593 /DNA_START=125 /DNA_END=1315 /DNA_ORIENTATION=-